MSQDAYDETFRRFAESMDEAERVAADAVRAVLGNPQLGRAPGGRLVHVHFEDVPYLVRVNCERRELRLDGRRIWTCRLVEDGDTRWVEDLWRWDAGPVRCNAPCPHHRPWKAGVRAADSCALLGALDPCEPHYDDGTPERCPLRKVALPVFPEVRS